MYLTYTFGHLYFLFCTRPNISVLFLEKNPSFPLDMRAMPVLPKVKFYGHEALSGTSCGHNISYLLPYRCLHDYLFKVRTIPPPPPPTALPYSTFWDFEWNCFESVD